MKNSFPPDGVKSPLYYRHFLTLLLQYTQHNNAEWQQQSCYVEKKKRRPTMHSQPLDCGYMYLHEAEARNKLFTHKLITKSHSRPTAFCGSHIYKLQSLCKMYLYYATATHPKDIEVFSSWNHLEKGFLVLDILWFVSFSLCFSKVMRVEDIFLLLKKSLNRKFLRKTNKVV